MDKQMTEVKIFARCDCWVEWIDGYGRYIFSINNYKFDLKVNQLNYILSVTLQGDT